MVVKKEQRRKDDVKGEPIVVERTFAWFQKKFRRIVVRWERKAKNVEAFIDMEFGMI